MSTGQNYYAEAKWRAKFTVEDFHNTSMNLIEQMEKQTSVADLLASFKNQSTSDYLVVYLQLLTSAK
ncbi:hypothetical protein CB1_001095009 [Camelus ferus]|nr:hypothetical protein CB1_001095009 [Camelus ferus]